MAPTPLPRSLPPFADAHAYALPSHLLGMISSSCGSPIDGNCVATRVRKRRLSESRATTVDGGWLRWRGWSRQGWSREVSRGGGCGPWPGVRRGERVRLASGGAMAVIGGATSIRTWLTSQLVLLAARGHSLREGGRHGRLGLYMAADGVGTVATHACRRRTTLARARART